MTRRNKPKYRADSGPEASFWARLSEEEQILAIIQHHRLRSIKLPNARVHALAHLLVEQQLSSGEAPAVASTLERLLDEGLDRHEAIHAIGWALTTTMNEAAAGELAGDLNATYEHRLSRLPDSWWSEFEDDPDGS